MPVTTEVCSHPAPLQSPAQQPAKHGQQHSLAEQVWPNDGELSLRPPNLATVTRKQVQEYFENTYNLDELLFTAITGACNMLF
jgi:hypothetical protein